MVSIIIPTYNSGKCIGFCLNTIINQTYADKEVIIVDGLSSDDTIDIVKGYASKYPYVKYVSEKDSGIYDAMNKGIAMAKGQWLLFLGSDDRLYTNTVLEDVFSMKKNHLPDVLYGNVYSSRFNGKYDGVFSGKKLFHQNICHQAIFFKKTVFKIVGNFNLKYKMHADWEHNIRWFFNKRIKHQYIDIIISNYADGGLSSTLGDHAFIQEKPKIYFKHAYFFIDRSFRKELLNTLIFAPNTPPGKKLFYKALFHLNHFQ